MGALVVQSNMDSDLYSHKKDNSLCSYLLTFV